MTIILFLSLASLESPLNQNSSLFNVWSELVSALWDSEVSVPCWWICVYLENGFKFASHSALVVPEWVQPNICTQLFWAPMFTVITERLFFVVSSVVLFIKFLIALLFCFCHGANRASELLFTKTFIVFDIILNHGFLHSLVPIKSIFSGKAVKCLTPTACFSAVQNHYTTGPEVRSGTCFFWSDTFALWVGTDIWGVAKLGLWTSA